MSRKVNLKGLFDNGDLTYSLDAGVEDATSDGASILFNGIKNTGGGSNAQHLQINNGGGPEEFTLTFSKKIPANKIRIITNSRVVTSYDIKINSDNNTSQNNTNGVYAAVVERINDFNCKGLSSITFTLNGSYSGADHEFYEIELYILEGSDMFEFNDSVLTTKAWNSSRYDGKQLIAPSGINRATIDDTGNYGRTPIVQHYSRNIYLGSRIVGMEIDNQDDTSLLNFPGFSYVTVHEFITVNDDLSVTKTSVRGDIGEETKNKQRFYQSWYDDFPVKSKVSLKMMDQTLQQSLKPNYDIYNNSGQLQKLLLVHHNSSHPHLHVATYDSYASSDSDADNQFSFASSSDATIVADYYVFNKRGLIDEFFTGSLSEGNPLSFSYNPQIDPTDK